MSGGGSTSGSGWGFQCLAQPLEHIDGVLLAPDMAMTMGTFGNSRMDTCPENVTTCVVLMFLDEEVNGEKVVTGACYDPTAPWVPIYLFPFH